MCTSLQKGEACLFYFAVNFKLLLITFTFLYIKRLHQIKLTVSVKRKAKQKTIHLPPQANSSSVLLINMLIYSGLHKRRHKVIFIIFLIEVEVFLNLKLQSNR